MIIVVAFIVVVSVVVSATEITTGNELEELFANSLTRSDGLNLTPEQEACIREALTKIVQENPQLNWWFEAVQKSAKSLVERAKKCEALTNEGLKKICLLKVRIAAKVELSRLIKLLPEDQRVILDTIKAAVDDCLSG